MEPLRARAGQVWVLALTSIASFMISLDSQVVTTALNVIRADLDASMELLEWTVNAYILSFAVLLLGGSALGDRFGRRRMLIAGLGLFTAASAACGAAPNVATLIAARAIQGMGAALVMPLAMALLSGAFSAAERGKALGIFGSITGAAMIAGPVLGGAITAGFAWQWIFWINVPIGLILLPLTYRNIGETFGPRAKLDLLGIALVTIAALAFVWSLMRGNLIGWSSREVGGGFAIAAIGLALFIQWEARAAHPMLSLGLFRRRAFAIGNIASLPYYAAIYGTTFLLAQFLQAAQGYGPLGAGLRILPWTATLFFMAPIAGNLINRVGEKRLVVLGMFLQATGMGAIALIAAPGLSTWELALPLVLAGCGGSLVMPAAQSVVLNAAPQIDLGKASGTYNMLRFLGGMLGIAMLVAAFSATGSTASPHAFTAGFRCAMAIAAALSLLGGVASLLLPARPATKLVAQPLGA
ncbi:MAG TPA: MFS transporter [Stellaceae bacterium]|jgi:EmrB/QacA subfamily drug resistance transporter|nr:MFS transporter [Stellaceae bacterium]